MDLAMIGLIFCNLLWSLAYPASKYLLSQGYENLEVSFIRYFLGAVLLGAIYFFRPSVRSRSKLKNDRTLIVLCSIGLFSFYLTPLFQMTGLKIGRAMDSSLMIAIEPLSVIILAMVIFKEKLNRFQILGIALAIGGVMTISEVTVDKIIEFKDARLIASLLFVASTLSEAMFTILSRFLSLKRTPIEILLFALCSGLFLIFIHNMSINPKSFSGIATLVSHSNLKEMLLFVALGWGATAFGYLFWIQAMKNIPISVMAVSLYIQPVLGAIASSLILDEKASPSIYYGGVLIFLGIYLATKKQMKCHS